jgi:hypothetical protein
MKPNIAANYKARIKHLCENVEPNIAVNHKGGGQSSFLMIVLTQIRAAIMKTSTVNTAMKVKIT